MIMAPAKLMVLASVMLDSLAATVWVNSQRPFKIDFAYHKVVRFNASHFVAHLVFKHT